MLRLICSSVAGLSFGSLSLFLNTSQYLCMILEANHTFNRIRIIRFHQERNHITVMCCRHDMVSLAFTVPSSNAMHAGRA